MVGTDGSGIHSVDVRRRLLEARAIDGDKPIVGSGRQVATPGGVEVTRGFVIVGPTPESLPLPTRAASLAPRRRK